MKRIVVVFFVSSVILAASLAAESEDEATKLPNFSFYPLDGGAAVELESFQGKAVLLTFWASWCGPCRIELPEFQQLYDELASRGFELVTVNLDHAPVMAHRFLEQTRLSVPVFTMAEEDLQQLGVRAMPTTFLIDQERRLVQVFEGYSPDLSAYLRNLVLELLDSDTEQTESAA